MFIDNHHELLLKTNEFLDSGHKWTVGTYARNEDGVMVDPESRHAVCWCVSGVLCRYGRITTIPELQECMAEEIGSPVTRPGCAQRYTIGHLNDRMTFQQVKKALARAIEKTRP